MSDLFDQLKSAGPVKKKQQEVTRIKSPGPVKKKQQEVTPIKTVDSIKKKTPETTPNKSVVPVKKKPQEVTPIKSVVPAKKNTPQTTPIKSVVPAKKKPEETTALKTVVPIKNKPQETTARKTSTTNSNNHDKKVDKFNADHKSKSSASSSEGSRRDSMPPPASASVAKKSKSHKSRSLSPPKFGVETLMKSLKVKLERKKLEKFLRSPLDEHANNIRVKHKVTLTKAQQKLFEPSTVVVQKKSKSQILREFNIKPCKVRIHRDNLPKLLREFKNKQKSKKPATKESKTSGGNKRPATSNSGSPPSKKGKFSTPTSSAKKSSFFIKLNTSPPSKLEKRLKNLSRSSSAMAHHNKIRNSKTIPTTPTKFSRSQLIRSFGQRFFKVHVKIERCTHPLMLTFESNDRARRLQTKRNNKSKNLSVSFREQVEIFGNSSDSDDSFDEDFSVVPNRNVRKPNPQNSKSVPATPVVMPARLKKVENGKVVDDIELDPSLFLDPKILVASTPFSPGRKKREHKSFSPLKDEGTPSPRKEQLKLANEKIPPSGLRPLNIEDEDDEDDDCEYIVPIELPHRRTSQHSLDGGPSTSIPLAESTAMFTDDVEDLTEDRNDITNIDLTDETNNIVGTQNNRANIPPINTNNQLEIISDDSFQSGPGNFGTANNQARTDVALSSQQSTPTLEFNDGLAMAEEERASHQMATDHRPQNNGNYVGNTNENNVNFSAGNKQQNTMEDLSMNLFMDDSQSNENDNHSKSFVDSLINETIDKLTKDIDEGANDEHFTDTN